VTWTAVPTGWRHVPQEWNGTVVLFAHGFGQLAAQDAPEESTRLELLEQGYALVGSSYSGPSLWALESAVDDQYAPWRRSRSCSASSRSGPSPSAGPWAAW
jgi:hypothetical protein